MIWVFIIGAGVIFLALTSGVETLVLMQMHWAPLEKSFADALTANLASALLLALLAPALRDIVSNTPLFFIVGGFCLAAALIEGAILRLLRGRPLGTCYLSALAANGASFFVVLAAAISMLMA